ncbi:MAG: bifunctional glutamate N-acetyltransferase/amino-acid acetyltransferase ArgJ [Myxococcota bacterium]
MRIEGFRAAGVACGIKGGGALDLALIASDRPASVAGVFTRNQFPGAPVRVSRARARRGAGRAVVVNSGVANVATGPEGLAAARAMARVAARGLGVREGLVTVASTGVIGPALPLARIEAGIPLAIRGLSASGWGRAARAILTTDTRPKRAHVAARGFGLGGIAKGAGMTMPRMATMLSFLATDLAVEASFLREALREAVDPTFNALTIDGETSTSDTVLFFANGAAGNRPLRSGSARASELRAALREVCGSLVEQLARDGEGVSKLADVYVQGARRTRDAERVARSVANSLLVKTALFGRDPNWGRIVQAAGAAGVRLAPERLGVRLAGVDLLRGGRPVGGERALGRAARGLRRRRVTIEVSLGMGSARAHVLTTDLTYEYVRINAEYTT